MKNGRLPFLVPFAASALFAAQACADPLASSQTALTANSILRYSDAGAFLPTPPPPVNHPPDITCPALLATECGGPATVWVRVGDIDGGVLTVTWAVNGVPVQTNTVLPYYPQTAATGLLEVVSEVPLGTNLIEVTQANTIPSYDPQPPTIGLLWFVSELPLGTNLLEITVTDPSQNATYCSITITVYDTTPPVIGAASATPALLWPPNHKMVPVEVLAAATDACEAATWKITSVGSNEPVNGRGDGNTAPDWVITGDHTVNLRAERAGSGHGRAYWISIQATDTSGNVSPPTIIPVTVPR